MTTEIPTDPDPDAAIMARAQEIVFRECPETPCRAEVKECDAFALLSVRVARMEMELSACHKALERIADNLGCDDVKSLLWHKADSMTPEQVGY